jgi:hypothetical protein
MYWVAFSSFGIQQLSPGHFTWIHGLSAWTIVSLTVAVWAAKTHRVRTHRQYVVGSYFGLVGAGIAATAVPVRLVPQTVVHHPLALLAAVAVIGLLTVAIIRTAAARRSSDLGGAAATRRRVEPAAPRSEDHAASAAR